MELPASYLDTSLVSGLANQDLAEAEAHALLRLLQYHKQGKLRLLTSEVTYEEIAKVPAQFRAKHEVIYLLLTDVPTVETYRTNYGLPLRGVGGGRREDPLFTSLKDILPDEEDARHLFQAAKNGVGYFLTADRRTILSRRNQIRSACNMIAALPTEMLQIIENST